MTDLPSATIIVPVYNGERTIQACVASLVAQNYPLERYQVLVVDNNSTDRTCEIVQNYPVELFHERERQSSYAARNTAIHHAQGDIIAFTDADCVADKNWLREIVTPFAEPEIGGVGGRVLDASPTNLVESFVSNMGIFAEYPTDEVFLPVLWTLNAAYRKKCLEDVGGFNHNLYTGADIDLAWRVQLDTGAKVTYAQEAIIYHQHRTMLKALSKQLRRHGFGEILLDAMYQDQPGYQRTRAWQMHRMGGQVRALFTYIGSFAYRLLVWKLQGKDKAYVLNPLLWFVVESANLQGKVHGLWATRFITQNPAQRVWQDPGER